MMCIAATAFAYVGGEVTSTTTGCLKSGTKFGPALRQRSKSGQAFDLTLTTQMHRIAHVWAAATRKLSITPLLKASKPDD